MDNDRIVVINEKMFDTKVQKVLRDLGKAYRELEITPEIAIIVGLQVSDAFVELRAEFFREENS